MTLDDIVEIAVGDIDVIMVDKEGIYIETEMLRYDEGYNQEFLDNFGSYYIKEIWGNYERDNLFHEVNRVYLAVTISVETEDKK